MSEAAAWSPRPGHQCEVVRDTFVCFGGFGLIENPIDVWASPDGANWTLLDTAPWNATSPDEARYDFDSIAIGEPGQERILTVGGDRETFDFEDPRQLAAGRRRRLDLRPGGMIPSQIDAPRDHAAWRSA